MAAVTTFLAGAIVGGGVKWAYDKWQAQAEKPDLSLAAMREKSAATAQGVRETVTKAVRRAPSEAEAEEVTDEITI